MSSDQKIGTPFTLASLPRPINTGTGRTQASGVCSISGTKKRKRTEISVAVDGEGVLIYSLQNPQLVTSYALPPQISFETSPYSIYRKGSSTRSAFRFTYAAVAPSTTGEKSQILCFTEEIKRDGTTDTNKTAYTITNSPSKVIAIDSIVLSGDSANGASHDVLIVFENGLAVCLSSDLKTQRWKTELIGLLPKSKRSDIQDHSAIEFVSIISAKAALGGLLRSREDVAALLDPSSDRAPALMDLTPILCIISRQPSQRRSLSLFHVQPRAPDLMMTHMSPMKHLLTWDLPLPVRPIATPIERLYQLHSSTGILHELADGRLLSYSFAGTVPTLYSDFDTLDTSNSVFLRLSPDMLLTVSQKSWSIFDSKYSSIQAFLPREQIPEIEKESRKRKHVIQGSSKGSSSVPTLITFFNDIRLAVAIIDHELVGVQIIESVSRKRAKHNGTLLVNSLGKGLPSKPLKSGNLTNSRAMKDTTQWQDWQKKVHKLDKYASKGKVAEFESLLAIHLAIESTNTAEIDNVDSDSQLKLSNSTIAPPPFMNGVAADSTALDKDENVSSEQLQKWNVSKPLTGSERHQHRYLATYALRKIFRIVRSAQPSEKENRQASLKIVFFPPNVFEWLLLSGYLTKESICRSLLEESPEDLELLASILDGDIARAIINFDPDLHILSAVLNQSQFLPVGEVVQAIRILMQSLDDQPKTAKVSRLLTNGTSLTEDEMVVDIASEMDAATHDLDQAQSLLDNGLLIRSHTLRPALMRLHTFPVSVITSTLRSMLPRHELESLIQLLHSELKNGGWTSPYDFLDSSSPEGISEDPDDQAVAIIASLLNCALDAIGAGAWLASVGDPTSEETTDDIINDLLHDTSEALNGFWEARFMRGLLSEFLRYASNLSKSQKPTNKSLQNQDKPFMPAIPTNESLPMLPLGGKVDMGIEKTKPGKGGKREERSAREIGMLISKRVPKYSFERIVI